MPSRVTRRDKTTEVVIDLGSLGLDYESNKATARPETLTVGESTRLDSGAASRAPGAVKVYRATDVTGSWTFGATTKYATIPAASQLEIPAGGFALYLHFTAVRPSGGNTAYILSSRVDTVAYHVLSVTLSDAGVITVDWTKDSDASSVSVATSAVSAGATVHLLAVFDAVGGTFTVYVDGASSGTPVTGITATEKPKSGTGEAWHFGVHWNPATSAVVANTNFDGKLDGACLLSLRGMKPASGSPTLTATLLKHTLRQWPTPQMDAVLFCYDFDSDTVTSLTDRSRHKNTGTVTGTPTATAAVALASQPTHLVATLEFPSGRKVNTIGNYGRLFYEDIRGDT